MSEDKKSIITLVGLKQARRDFMFLNERHLKECENCDLFKVCIEKLEEGRIYKVVDVREKIFPCSIHEEGVQIVEVVEPNIQTNIEDRLAFPCGIITFSPQLCDKISCSNYGKCVPKGLEAGDRCKVIEVREQVECPLNLRLVLAVLQRVKD